MCCSAPTVACRVRETASPRARGTACLRPCRRARCNRRAATGHRARGAEHASSSRWRSLRSCRQRGWPPQSRTPSRTPRSPGLDLRRRPGRRAGNVGRGTACCPFRFRFRALPGVGPAWGIPEPRAIHRALKACSRAWRTATVGVSGGCGPMCSKPVDRGCGPIVVVFCRRFLRCSHTLQPTGVIFVISGSYRRTLTIHRPDQEDSLDQINSTSSNRRPSGW
jgi:hypothetical protein